MDVRLGATLSERLERTSLGTAKTPLRVFLS